MLNEEGRQTAIRLVVPDISQKGAFGANRFKICTNDTIITVFNTDLRPIWEKDSLHAINLFQTNGVRDTGHRGQTTLEATNRNLATIMQNRSPSHVGGPSTSPLSKSGKFGETSTQAAAPAPARRGSKSALFDPNFQNQISALRTYEAKSSYQKAESPNAMKNKLLKPNMHGIEEAFEEDASANVTAQASPR